MAQNALFLDIFFCTRLKSFNLAQGAIVTSNFDYQSDEYDRNAQRFVIPLYIKNELGNCELSSTGTLVKYNDHHYIIFAAHALRDVDFGNVYTFSADGNFSQICEYAIGHQIFEPEDIVVVDFWHTVFDGKNYFNLNSTHLNGFKEKRFAWIGFPLSKAELKNAHNSKSKDTLRKQYVHFNEDGIHYSSSAKYFIIDAELMSNDNAEITGKYDRKNINLKYAGQVSTGPHPAGMSGGAIYFFAKNQRLKDSIDDTFSFAGIGIEYRKDNKIVGVPRTKIIELLERFDRENPLKLQFDYSTAR